MIIMILIMIINAVEDVGSVSFALRPGVPNAHKGYRDVDFSISVSNIHYMWFSFVLFLSLLIFLCFILILRLPRRRARKLLNVWG